MKRDQTYQVVSRSAVTVEFTNGNVVSYPAGFMFQAHPTNKSVTRLLRQNLIRPVTPREVPRFAVDTQSNVKPTPAPKAVIPPLQATTKGSKRKSKKPNKGEE
jgi:hypothetical protein